jgi:hypothetical protein
MTFQEAEYQQNVEVEPVRVPVGATLPPPVATRADIRTAHSSRFLPDALVAGAVGLVLVVAGLIAITRGGFTGPMSDPVVSVAGFRHTTTLGLIEIVLGLCLLGAGASRSRSGAAFFGTVLGIAGFVGAVQTSSFEKSLALQSSMAWLAVVAGAIVLLAALLMPRFAKDSTTVRTS